MNLDWAPITARWLILVGAGIWLAFAGWNAGVMSLALVGVLGNLAATLLVVSNQSHFTGFRLGSWLLDVIVAGLMIYFSALDLGLAWALLLPVVTGAFYFRWLGAVLSALISAAAPVVVQRLQGSPLEPFVALIFLIVSLVVGLSLAFWVGGAAEGGERKRLSPAAAKKEQERRSTIFDMISALNASLNYQRVLDAALDVSAQALDSLAMPQVDRLISAVLLFSVDKDRAPELRITTSRNMMPGDRDAGLPATSGVLASAIDEGAPELTRTVTADPELGRLTSLSGAKAAYAIPLRTGLDAYGLLLFAHADADFFTTDCREVLDIVGKQAVLAIQNARLYQDLEQEKNRLMEAQEESRKKLARDLHDGPTQSVSAIAMRVNFARRLLERDGKAAAEELYKIEDLARRTTKEIRHMLFTLRPLVLESQGLAAALQSMAEKMEETFEQQVLVEVDERVVEEMETGKQAVVFYIAEEAVNNARKHAQAEHIWVRLRLLRDQLSLLEVEDDGVGFDVQSVGASYESRGSLGMINLRERTELVSGVLRIDSSKGKGTRVQVVIPLTQDAADRIRRSA